MWRVQTNGKKNTFNEIKSFFVAFVVTVNAIHRDGNTFEVIVVFSLFLDVASWQDFHSVKKGI